MLLITSSTFVRGQTTLALVDYAAATIGTRFKRTSIHSDEYQERTEFAAQFGVVHILNKFCTLCVVVSAISSTDIALILAMVSATKRTNAGSLRLPRCGTGVR